MKLTKEHTLLTRYTSLFPIVITSFASSTVILLLITNNKLIRSLLLSELRSSTKKFRALVHSLGSSRRKIWVKTSGAEFI